jgi:hypothetical protein
MGHTVYQRVASRGWGGGVESEQREDAVDVDEQ